MDDERLNSLDARQQDLVCGLLYRAGSWMSQTEDSEGETDDARENDTIVSVLKMISGKASSPFLRAAAERALESRNRWPAWEEESFDILPDVVSAAKILRNLLPEKEYKSYKRALMKIATDVAQAGTEFSIETEIPEDTGFFGKLLSKLRPVGQYDEGHPVNVSPGEESALTRLARVLREVG